VPVKTIANGIYSTGEGNVVWDGRDESQTPVQTGMYAVILEAIDATTGEVRREKIAIAVGN
jgi:flagellar hook assembly protein FlgD